MPANEINYKIRPIEALIEHHIKSLDFPDRPRTLYDPIRYSLENGGKRLRPKLVILGCAMCHGNADEAIPAAIAVELLHNFTLIHDDIMDQAETRRNRPSVYKKWNANTAILSGDILFAHASRQLDYYFQSEQYTRQDCARINSTFLNMVMEVCRGQALDLEFEENESVGIDEYLEMIKAKTAALISGSLMLGALIAGADEETVQAAARLGLHTGIAFQIQDDLLDVTGDAEVFGKKTGGDIREGKKTWLTIAALKKAPEIMKQKLVSVLNSASADEDQIKSVIDLYHQKGIIEDCEQAIADHYNRAMQSLQCFDDSAYKNEIKKLLSQLMIRES